MFEFENTIISEMEKWLYWRIQVICFSICHKFTIDDKAVYYDSYRGQYMTVKVGGEKNQEKQARMPILLPQLGLLQVGLHEWTLYCLIIL